MSDFLPVDLFKDIYLGRLPTILSKDEAAQRSELTRVTYDKETGRCVDNSGKPVQHELIGAAQSYVPQTSSLDQLAAEHKPPEANAFFPHIGKSSVAIQYLRIE